tara:strand:- start:397 stop:654 length:258 start_codon:yes stop_codon:yes gene_type:complete
MYNIFKILYNIGHIIYYKLHMAWLHLIDVQIPITNPFNSMGTMKPNPIGIREDDIAKALGHMDEDGSYIKDIKYKPYDGPVCETP